MQRCSLAPINFGGPDRHKYNAGAEGNASVMSWVDRSVYVAVVVEMMLWTKKASSNWGAKTIVANAESEGIKTRCSPWCGWAQCFAVT